MKYLLVLVAILSLGAVDDGAKLEMDEWSFDWKVVEASKLEFGVMHDPKTTKLYLWDDSHRIRFDQASAEKLADGLGRFDEFRKSLNEEENKEIECGDLKLTYRNSKKNGFYAAVGENQRFAFGSLFVDAKQAKTLIPHLNRSKRIVKLVKEKIVP